MVNTIKRSAKGKSLTHDEFDGNWTAIENHLNAHSPRQRYEISAGDIGPADDSIFILISVNVLEPVSILPTLKWWVVEGGTIVACNINDEVFLEESFPILGGTTLTKKVRVEIPVEIGGRLPTVQIFFEDSEGHSANNLIIPPIMLAV